MGSRKDLRHGYAEPRQEWFAAQLLVDVDEFRLRVQPIDGDGAIVRIDEPDEWDAGFLIYVNLLFDRLDGINKLGERISSMMSGRDTIDQRRFVRFLHGKVGRDIDDVDSDGGIRIAAQTTTRFAAQDLAARFRLAFPPGLQEM